MPYDNYFKRLEIAKLPTVAQRRAALIEAGLTYMVPTIDDVGFYRKPITKRLPNGKVQILDYVPVALFAFKGNLEGVVGDHDATPEEITDLWTWISTYPIEEQLYRAVAEKGEPWPDLPPPQDWGENTELVNTPVIPRDRIITSTDNNPPEALPHIQYAEAIDNAIGAAKELQATDEASAAVVLGAKNRIAELRLKADKAGHAIYDPLREKYLAEQKRWAPIVTYAEGMEKELNRRYLIWRNEELRKAAAAKAEAAQKQWELDEANERAAQRAIAQGNPEPTPEAPVEAPPALPPAPVPVEPTYRAPGQRTRPKEAEGWHLDAITDYDACYLYFKDAPEVMALLGMMAKAAIKAGRDVPGTIRHWGLL